MTQFVLGRTLRAPAADEGPRRRRPGATARLSLGFRRPSAPFSASDGGEGSWWRRRGSAGSIPSTMRTYWRCWWGSRAPRHGVARRPHDIDRDFRLAGQGEEHLAAVRTNRLAGVTPPPSAAWMDVCRHWTARRRPSRPAGIVRRRSEYFRRIGRAAWPCRSGRAAGVAARIADTWTIPGTSRPPRRFRSASAARPMLASRETGVAIGTRWCSHSVRLPSRHWFPRASRGREPKALGTKVVRRYPRSGGSDSRMELWPERTVSIWRKW